MTERREIHGAAAGAFAHARNQSGGVVASYIPQLALVNPSLYGMACCDIDGHITTDGDSEQRVEALRELATRAPQARDPRQAQGLGAARLRGWRRAAISPR